MEKESVRKDSSSVGSERLDLTLSKVPKVWADYQLGHTAPPGRITVTPSPSWAQITASPILGMSPGRMGWSLSSSCRYHTNTELDPDSTASPLRYVPW